MSDDVLTKGTPVELDLRVQVLAEVAADWPDQVTLAQLADALYRFDLERASRMGPPRVSVRVDGVPGEFSTLAGSGLVTYRPPQEQP
jgi:hypothetical protein